MAIVLVVADGSNLEVANVYDTTADAATYLTDRGYTVFAAGSPAEQDRWHLESTEIMEREMLHKANGIPLGGDDQLLLHPRVNSIDRRFRLFDSDELPLPHREGIFLLDEDVAVADGAGTRLTDLDGRDFIEKEKVEGVDFEYRHPPSFSDKHRAAFDRAREAYPDGRRALRA